MSTKLKYIIIMKKTILLLFVVLCTSLSFAQNPKDVDFTILTDPAMEGNFYPSFAIWNSTQEDPTDIFYSFYLNAPKAGSIIRIKVEQTALNEETIIQEVAESKGEMVIDPIIKWKYDHLAQLNQSGAVTLTCILEIDGKEIDRINHVVKYRTINECIYGCLEDDEWIDLSAMFAMYVNEDYPQIDKILQEILADDRDRAFIDYQGDAEDFINQIFYVWQYFSLKGTRYSNVVNTSNVSETLGVQYVRFFDQVINNVQANCVDGSVMLASIYRKIGFDVDLIVLPAHCMLAIRYPGYLAIEGVGETDPEDGGMVIIETTLMGSNMDPSASLTEAMSIHTYPDVERIMEQEEAVVVNIEQARAIGFMPIRR